MSNKHITRPTKWAITPEGESLFCERVIEIEIVDEAAGEFVEVKQHLEGYGKIGIEPSEWPSLRLAIDMAIKQCREKEIQ